MLSNRIGDYWYISQGKTRIPGVNDGEDMEETDVSPAPRVSSGLSEIHNPSLLVEIVQQRRTCAYISRDLFFKGRNSQDLSSSVPNDERGGV